MNARILYLEDNDSTAIRLRQDLSSAGFLTDWVIAPDVNSFGAALGRGGFDLVVANARAQAFGAPTALELTRKAAPALPFVCLANSDDAEQRIAMLAAGATDYVILEGAEKLVDSFRRAISYRPQPLRGPARLVAAVQALSLARDLPTIMAIVRQAARELTGADGATFILRDDDKCHYADEDAIAPLWKGHRFPMQACISGWAMLNRKPAVIEDIYVDPRIPHDAYRPTFVKSLAMVPIRTQSPIGAIGNYWASRHLATPAEVELLQSLANTTAVAMENVRVYSELETRVQERTAELEIANRELEAFSYSVSHDLRAPLRGISGFSEFLARELGENASPKAKGYLEHVRTEAKRMNQLIDSLLGLARVTRKELLRRDVDVGALARETFARLQAQDPARKVALTVADNLNTRGDLSLVQAVIENLVSNAWKYSGKSAEAHIEVGKSLVERPEGTKSAFFVRDNGVGFNMQYADRLFTAFQRLHSADDFPGHGVGLATVQRIIHRHGGRIWAESEPGKGATFYFTLPDVAAAGAN